MIGVGTMADAKMGMRQASPSPIPSGLCGDRSEVPPKRNAAPQHRYRAAKPPPDTSDSALTVVPQTRYDAYCPERMTAASAPRSVEVMDHVTPWWRRPLVVDIALTIAIGLVLIVQVSVASEPNSRAVDMTAYALVVVIALGTMLRRLHPVWVLVASVILVFVYHALDYPAIGLSIPLAIPLFTVAMLGRTIAGVVVVACLAGTFGWLIAGESQTLLTGLSVVVREAAIMIAVVLAGSAYRSRRLLAEETTERLRLAGIERAAASTAERVEMAREIHDVIAHTVAVIGVQARVANEALDADVEQARRALEIIDEASKEATAELRTTVALLRQDNTPVPLSPVAGLQDLESLINSMSAGGLAIDLELGEVGDLPGTVERTVYRVVQEALTNVVRHSDADHVNVRIERRSETLTIVIEDDGSTSPGPEGHGIRGMRERVSAHGGSLRTGRMPAGGFRVEAVIPL